MKKLITLSVMSAVLITAMLFLNSCSEKKEIENDDLNLELYDGTNLDEEAIFNEVLNSGSSDLKCTGFPEICGDLQFYPLIASQHYYIGALMVYNDDENLYVTYWTGWWKMLSDFHLYVGTEEDLPLTSTGNPRFGKFPYKDEEIKTGFKTFVIPLSEIPECPIIVAHAVLRDHTVLAFSGNPFDGSRWGWIIDDFCIRRCIEEKEIVTAVKVYLGDPAVSEGYQWWAVSGGEGSDNNLRGIGINKYMYNEENVYPLNKDGDANKCVGTITVSDYWENDVHYLEVVVDTYDDKFLFFDSHLYAGSEAGYWDNYLITDNGTNLILWYAFPFEQYDMADQRVFKIPFDMITE